MKLSIIIVSYRCKHHLALCLKSCEKAMENLEAEIIVVDNASNDGSETYIKTYFPELNWIQNEENIGFGRANNLGVSKAKGTNVLILNPDTVLAEDTISELFKFSEGKEKLGAVGVKLVDIQGTFHPESKRNLPTFGNTFQKLFGNFWGLKSHQQSYYFLDLSADETGKVPVLVGAFIWMKKSVYESVGGFDEDFFMYGEDIDFSKRIMDAGYVNYYLGKVTALHFKGESSKDFQNRLGHFFTAMHIYIGKHYARGMGGFLFKVILGAAIEFRRWLTYFERKDYQKKYQTMELQYPQDFEGATANVHILDAQNDTFKTIIEEHANSSKKNFIALQNPNILVGEKQVLEW